MIKQPETIKQKVTGFRFLVFVITAILDFTYIVMCKYDPSLKDVMDIVGKLNWCALVLIGGKTVTDSFGKKL